MLQEAEGAAFNKSSLELIKMNREGEERVELGVRISIRKAHREKTNGGSGTSPTSGSEEG